MKTLLEFDYKKAIQAINFLSTKEGGKIDKLKVIKLIWLADRYHLRKYGRPIINDTYYAMKLGPVASSAKDILGFNPSSDTEKQYLEKFLSLSALNKNVIKSIAEVDTDIFSKTEIEALENIYNEYGNLKAPVLIDVSHQFPEWKKFKKEIESGSSTRKIMNYHDFFSNPSESVCIKNIFNESEDELENSKYEYEESHQMASFWL